MSQAAESRAGKPAMLKDRTSSGRIRSIWKASWPKKSAWCATPRAALRRTI